MDISSQNITAWNNLYGSVDKSVWGNATIGFLQEFIPHVTQFLTSDCNMLDAGAGEGRNLKIFLKTNANIYACDASLNGLQKLVRNIKENIKCTQCNLNNMPFKSDFFEFVLLTDVIETLPNPTLALKEIHRILKPQGLLLCNIPGSDDGVAEIDMTSLQNGGYLYNNQYYYKFNDEKEAMSFFKASKFDVVVNKVVKWMEAPHPNFRDKTHEHVSRVFLVRKVI